MGDLRTRQQPIDQRFPFGVERRAMVVAACAFIPVARVCRGAFFAVEVSVDRHSFCSLQRVDQVMGASPVSLGIPP